jgi:hypothetical protein
MQTPEAKRKDKNQGFVEAKELEEIIDSSDYALLEQDDDEYAGSDDFYANEQNGNTTNNLSPEMDEAVDPSKSRQKTRKHIAKDLLLENDNAEIDEKELQD